jgi:alkanesulfonate monooxygenase SsuD/methylene tetrahydromethanopterin reductase-like flavin-dependent oxidoreductase (luciferase family)
VGLRHLADTLGDDLDLSVYPIDGPLPEVPQGNRGSRRDQVVALARREKLSLRQLYLRLTARNAAIGTPSDIADVFEEWFQSHAADGFNVLFPYYPGGLEDFVELVIPELQRRGLFRREYTGRTLREHLGLARPESRYKSARKVSS